MKTLAVSHLVNACKPGSGFSDILMSCLMSTGSLQGVTTGKNYSRAIHCHKVMVEAIERLLLHAFESISDPNMSRGNTPEKMGKLEVLIKERNKEKLESVVNDHDFHSYLEVYSIFREGVKRGNHGKTAKFWLSYMDHVWLVLHLPKAIKTNYYYLYGACLHQMTNLFATMARIIPGILPNFQLFSGEH